MALTVRERTGHRGVNRHRYVHLPVQERGHDRQNSHMGFLLFIFLPIAGCIYAIAHLLAPYHDSFVDDVFGGTPTPARPWEHNSATSVNWYFPGWSFTTHTIRNRYGMSTASAYRLNDPISVLPRVGGASPGGDLWKRDFCYTTAEPSHTSQHLHPAPAQHHTHQQPMATALSSNSHGSKMRTIVHDDWVIPGQEPLKPDTTIILYDSLLRPSVRHEYHLHSFRLGKNRGFRSLIDKHKGVTTELKMDYTEIAFSRILWAIYGIDKEIKVNIISLGDLAQIYEASLRFELPELGWKVLPDLFADIGENFSWEKVARSDVVDVLSYLDPQFGNRAFHQLLRNEVRKRAIEFSERLPDGLGSLKMLCPRLWKDLEER